MKIEGSLVSSSSPLFSWVKSLVLKRVYLPLLGLFLLGRLSDRMHRVVIPDVVITSMEDDIVLIEYLVPAEDNTYETEQMFKQYKPALSRNFRTSYGDLVMDKNGNILKVKNLYIPDFCFPIEDGKAVRHYGDDKISYEGRTRFGYACEYYM